MFRAIRSAAAVLNNMETERGDATLYPLPTAKTDPIPGRSHAHSRLLSPRDKKEKKALRLAGHTSAATHNRPIRKN